jgi:penicillin amidase
VLALSSCDCQFYGTAEWHTMPDQETSPRRRRPLAVLRSWPRWARVSTYVAAGLALVLLAGAVTVGVLLRRPLPEESGTAELPGLEAAVEVVRDEHGVPQVYADSLTDLVKAQGYVHAQERFFEMDVRRHATAGRLAEMFGEAALDSDKAVRTMGWRHVAERELAIVAPRTRQVLEAYADGVNAYLHQRAPSQLAVEYTVLNGSGLDYRPEDWSPVDSLAWLKAMAWDLRGNMGDEVDRALTAAAVGERRAEQLWPAYPFDEHAPIVDGGAVVDGVFEPEATTGGTRLPQRPAWTADQQQRWSTALRNVRDALDAVPSWLGRGDGIGSNSWVVDGEHSATGAPLLANDPHLGVSMPGVWMQMGLHCRTVSEACPMEVAGFTFSGVPGVVIGHNADIAWGFTNLGPDVADLYLERVVGDGYRYDGAVLPLRTRTETIEVRGADPVTIEVRATRHGPLLSDVDDGLAAVGAASGQEHAVALAWTALQPSATADAILAMNTATDWDSFREAAASFAVPAQNLVYADRAGHIGYQAPGLVPIRKSGNDGRWPAEGWRPEDDWSGETVPFEGLPHVLDPEEGFVVTANQAVVGPDYPYALTQDWDRGYRAQRIRDLLVEEGELSVAEMAELQLDDRNPMAATLVPYLLDVDLPRGYASAGQRLLDGWDGSQSADSAPAAYYNVVWRTLLEHTFHDELPEDVWPDGGQRWFAVIGGLLREPADPWWDDVTTEGVVERRDDVLRTALLEARDELTRLQSLHPEDWSWGALHTLELRSPSLGESGIGPVEALVNRGDWEVGGGSSTVDATAWDAAEGYAVTAAPSMRMVVSLADLDDSRWINVTGVSGHPASGHYTDQTDLWARGETIAWPFSREAVEATGEDVLRLVPGEVD